MKILPDNDLNKILIKALDEDVKIHNSLREGSLANLLIEQLDDKDVSKVRTAIENAAKQIDEIDNYLNTVNVDRTKLGGVETFIKGMKKALDTANSELAGLNIASFGNNKLANFFGQKVTLPQITQAAIALHTKAQDFGKGFETAINLVINNLTPLIKNDEDKDKPIIDLVGTEGFPDKEKLVTSLDSGMKKAFGGGFFKKVKSFFSKSASGAEKKVMAAMPDISPAELAEGLTDAILTSSLNDLSTPPPQVSDDSASLNQVSQDSVDAEKNSEEGEDAAPDEESAQQQSDNELRQSVQDAAKSDEPPGDAMASAIEDWVEDLPKTSKEAIKTKNRDEELKASIRATADDLAGTLSKSVSDAVSDWRAQHEDDLLKSKRFSKKNLDSLSELIPKLASHLMKQANESGGKLTVGYINKFTKKVLSKWAKKDRNLLSEVLFPHGYVGSKSKKKNKKNNKKDSTDIDRWMKLAGIS